MARALALTQHFTLDPFEIARSAIVIGCALVLIAAGQALPWF